MRRKVSALLSAAAVLAAVLVAAPAGNAAPATPSEWREVFSADGTISKVRIPVEPKIAPKSEDLRAAAATSVVALQETGPASTRFNMVILGDGYTAGEMGLLRRHAEQKWAEISATDPWRKYAGSINVWLVNVVSNESGVSNDPSQGISRDTALGMYFFCGGVERLLCLNESKAQAYAAQAPGVDAIVAVGNTYKYGGAGYPSLSTVSGGDPRSGRIAIHELGHSVGGLADEYFTPGTTYTGDEPTQPNVTRDPGGSKWASYLGRSTPDGGVIGAYLGGSQYEYGIYRPSSDSLMRSLDKPFNLPSLAAMDRAIGSRISGGSSGCAAQANTRSGSLTSGGGAYQPDGGSFYAAAGTHRACLAAPAGAQFALDLMTWNGSAWQTVATSGADGRLSYGGADGYYTYLVRSVTGAGSYTLTYDTP
ncbi:M64 family metallopeptidase [Streptomyces sp. NRRL WC-3742]|uniref:M64 family metallopeptidase n=1 Tax=Streptomyces sp. NRRL WC-3742 TaxID=1463934 RepID=UPI00068EAE90|nr:M64 family metallopeptidase [Streptomyces sp. NRRL WC-3742]